MRNKILIGAAAVLIVFALINVVTLVIQPRDAIEEGAVEVKNTVSEDVILVEDEPSVSEDEIVPEGPPFESEEMVFVANSGEEYTVLVPEYKNKYVELIREKAGISDDVYPNSSIIKLKSGDFAWYYDGNGGETRIYNLAKLSKESTEEFLTEFADHTNEYYDKANKMRAPKIDLDGDGQITLAEIEIVAIYVTYDPEGKAYVGSLSFESEAEREVWWEVK